MNTTTRTALLIEDDPDFRSLVREALEALGLKVIEAADGTGALLHLELLVPDIVCLDVMLPELSGYEVLEAIRNSEPLAHVPVVMMSARGHPQDRAQAEELGASAYLIKPFTRADLSDEVQRLLFPQREPLRRAGR
jgi:CheY-like chemotaxis protein